MYERFVCFFASVNGSIKTAVMPLSFSANNMVMWIQSKNSKQLKNIPWSYYSRDMNKVKSLLPWAKLDYYPKYLIFILTSIIVKWQFLQVDRPISRSGERWHNASEFDVMSFIPKGDRSTFHQNWVVWYQCMHSCMYTIVPICPKKNYNQTFRMDNFQSSEWIKV